MKGKVEVLISNLRKRKSPSLNGVILGYINKGVYDFTESKIVDNYTWVKINDFWIATKEGEYTKIIDKDKKEKECLDKIKEQLEILSQLYEDKDIVLCLKDDE